jgi:putative oxidoreductase
MLKGCRHGLSAFDIKLGKDTRRRSQDWRRELGLMSLVAWVYGEVTMNKFFATTWDVRSLIFIRLAVGLIFLTQGILKYTDPHMGVLRFARIGFPYPDFTTHFVGTFEIACGLLVLIGLLTRVASIPLLIVILTAIVTTKTPELFRPGQGFWFMVSDARTDFAMTLSLLFLISVGAGSWSLDAWLRGEKPNQTI